ncbi:FxsA family membrane protein [Streptomyces sp. RFCAC02]|uniref:FxsA family membrane protein n=1 Tax=Streptomyces sp. RFCAC02 TaxID=2499143 RepID=UPI001021BEAF|nr:FxsA family membrane protein [Streptomyces sp. RFCAC02]
MTTGSPSPYRDTGRGTAGSPTGPRRRRRRPWAPIAVAVWALLEIWLLTLVGRAAGGMTVFLLLVAGAVVGAIVIKRAGRRAWARLTEGLRPPGAGTQGGATATRGGNGLTMLGGLFLMVPGIISDVVGLLCVFPPTARLLRRTAGGYLARRRGPVGEAFRDARWARDRARVRRPDGRVVPGEVVRDETGDGSAPRDGRHDD